MIRLIVDSMSDITQNEAAALHIEVLPLTVRFGREEFLDGVELLPEAFYARLVKAAELPKTSQITPERFLSAFERNLLEGDEIVCITGSSKLSGTYQSAVIARSMASAPERIHLVDSLNASLGEAQLVFQAVALRDAGAGAEEIAAQLEQLKRRIRVVGMTEQLKYLVMGGRLSGVSGAIGTTLSIKPMLRLEDGLIQSAGLCRSMASVHRWYLDAIRTCPPDLRYPMIIAGAHCPELVAGLRTELNEAGYQTDMIRKIGAVIGTYTGPGMTAICWIAA